MRMMTGLGCLLAIAACDAFAGQEEIAKYDPRMALEKGTVDGCHPNDLGMQSMKNAFGKAIRTALQASRRGD